MKNGLQHHLIKQTKDKNPSFYKHYPECFQDYFGVKDEGTINQLSEAAYLYYCSLLLADSLLDEGDLSKFPSVQLYQEKAIKTLTTIYGQNNIFWNYWEERKNEYYAALKIEKGISNAKPISFQKYTDLADKKSAFAKVAIDSVYCLSKEKDTEIYRTLLRSQQYFSVGFQLYDDVQDFLKDAQKGQFNWAVYTLRKKLTEEEKGLPMETQYKLFFIKNIGQEILLKSIVYFKKAHQAVIPLQKNSLWILAIKEIKKEVSEYLGNIIDYLRLTKTRVLQGKNA